VFFGDTLASDNIPFGVMSNDLSSNFDRPIINKTGKYMYKLAISPYNVSDLNDRLISDWWV
jgi:hypothetical protein